MTPWKVFLFVLVLVLPGGSLLLLALATAKALYLGKNRLAKRCPAPAQPLGAAGSGKA